MTEFDARVGPPLTPTATSREAVSDVVSALNGLLTTPVTPTEASRVAVAMRLAADRLYGQMVRSHLSIGVVTTRFTMRDVAAAAIAEVLPTFRMARERQRAQVERARVDREGGVPAELTSMGRPTAGVSVRVAPVMSTGGAGFSTGAIGGAGGSR